jgi:hypothetical protein
MSVLNNCNELRQNAQVVDTPERSYHGLSFNCTPKIKQSIVLLKKPFFSGIMFGKWYELSQLALTVRPRQYSYRSQKRQFHYGIGCVC